MHDTRTPAPKLGPLPQHVRQCAITSPGTRRLRLISWYTAVAVRRESRIVAARTPRSCIRRTVNRQPSYKANPSLPAVCTISPTPLHNTKSCQTSFIPQLRQQWSPSRFYKIWPNRRSFLSISSSLDFLTPTGIHPYYQFQGLATERETPKLELTVGFLLEISQCFSHES